MTKCKHKQSHMRNKMWACVECGQFTHARCSVKSKQGEQCWLVKGHEYSKCEMDRSHMALVIGEINE